jgi:hypothetical protein
VPQQPSCAAFYCESVGFARNIKLHCRQSERSRMLLAEIWNSRRTFRTGTYDQNVGPSDPPTVGCYECRPAVGGRRAGSLSPPLFTASPTAASTCAPFVGWFVCRSGGSNSYSSVCIFVAEPFVVPSRSFSLSAVAKETAIEKAITRGANRQYANNSDRPSGSQIGR